MADEIAKVETAEDGLSPAVEAIVADVALRGGVGPWRIMRMCYVASLLLPDDLLKSPDFIPLAMSYRLGNEAYRHLTTRAQQSRVNAQEQSALWIVVLKDYNISIE